MIMADNPTRDWKTLAQLASVEQDPEKLSKIIHELNDVLLERERQRLGKTQSRRLLLVDDDKNIEFTLLQMLRERGFEVELTATVSEALRKIESHKFDILVSDLNLSEPSDGFRVVAAMRQAHPRCVIVLLTGYPAFESAVAGIHHAVDDYIVKPADYDALIQTLEEKLAAKRGF
jgi:ActR/RegA family two-component response regulator